MIFLLPQLLYILDTDMPPFLRETEVLAQDAAQMLMYGHTPQEIPLSSMRMWVDSSEFGSCLYKFRYCTVRYYNGGEHRICVAECLP